MAAGQAMTYRTGAYVVDTRTDRLGRVTGVFGAIADLRTPGGAEWRAPHSALRLATTREMEAAGKSNGVSTA